MAALNKGDAAAVAPTKTTVSRKEVSEIESTDAAEASGAASGAGDRARFFDCLFGAISGQKKARENVTRDCQEKSDSSGSISDKNTAFMNSQTRHSG
jgi:hypothetical protein